MIACPDPFYGQDYTRWTLRRWLSATPRQVEWRLAELQRAGRFYEADALRRDYLKHKAKARALAAECCAQGGGA